MLNATDVTKMKTPGSATTAGWVYTDGRRLLSIAPHSGVGGAEPRPMKLNAEAIRMLSPTRLEAYTKIGLKMFGSTWSTITRAVPAPLIRAASMYSCTITWRAADSATRAIGGMNTMLRAMIELWTPAPSDAAMAIA